MDYGAMHHKRFGIPKVPGKQRPCLAPPPDGRDGADEGWASYMPGEAVVQWLL